MRHLINAAILLLVATFPATAQDEHRPKPNVSPETLALYEPGEFKGVQYRLMKPIDYDPSTTHPLILSLHGGSGRGTQNIKNLIMWNEYLADEDLRRKHPAFVLTPQSNGRWLDNTSEVRLYSKPRSLTIDDLPGMEVVAQSEVRAGKEKPRSPHIATVNDGPKGNVVFDAGSIWWARGLSSPPGHVLPATYSRPRTPGQ